MKLNVFNIRDERVGKYGSPIITQKTAEQICADYLSTVENLQANIERYNEFAPEKAAELLLSSSQLKDCVIYTAGTWDVQTGKFCPVDEPVLVCRISDFYREVNKNA